MKAHIMTFINLYNYGSVLQAYALNRFLRESVIDADTIYYDLGGRKDIPVKVKLKLLLLRIVYFIPITQRERKFSDFIQQSIPLFDETHVFLSPSDLEMHEWNSDDIFIVGSDQCWCELNRKEFFLNYAAGKKIAYAVSMGDRLLTAKEIETIQQDTKDFFAVSLREQYHQQQFHNTVDNCIDPVFLLDPKQWADIADCAKAVQVNKKYIFVYTIYGSEAIDECLTTLQQSAGMDIVLVGGVRKKTKLKGVKFLRTAGVEDWLWLIKHADIVVTDSFHATAFSLIFHKKVFPFTKGQYSRIDNVLQYFDLEDLAIHPGENPRYDQIINYEIMEQKCSNENEIVCRSRNWLIDKLSP